MPVPKGTRIGGRQKGTPNKTTAAVKEAIERAFVHLEESTEGFNAWAAQNQTIFYTQLLPKIIPAQLQHSGLEGGPLRVVIERQGDRSA